jgi:hypothetical protein
MRVARMLQDGGGVRTRLGMDNGRSLPVGFLTGVNGRLVGVHFPVRAALDWFSSMPAPRQLALVILGERQEKGDLCVGVGTGL